VVRHDAPQCFLSLDKWLVPQILAIQVQVERAEPSRTAPEQELIELAATVLVQASDLSGEHSVQGFQRKLYAGAQLSETGEVVAVARDLSQRLLLLFRPLVRAHLSSH
jgi:hypothetical protein